MVASFRRKGETILSEGEFHKKERNASEKNHQSVWNEKDS
uniref:Uncharacterized protein n=1 Tax=Parascaris univalens TaxID=6257 RepID=A0A915CC82_PARUN